MKTFKGFAESETFTQLPDAFFHQLLHGIDEAAELKVTLYFLWRLEHMDGPFRALCESDFDVKELGLSAEEIRLGLEKAVKRGSMLKSQHEADVFYFLNSPRGRAAAEAFAEGRWRESAQIVSTPLERPNIFRLYEENIGPLTPLIADALKDAEETFSEEWVAEAIEKAAINNVRKLPYIVAILKSRKEEGSGEKQDGRNTEEDRRQNIKRKIEDFLGK